MFDAGILAGRREGNSVYYLIADPVAFTLCELVWQSTREQIRIKLGALSRTVGSKKRRLRTDVAHRIARRFSPLRASVRNANGQLIRRRIQWRVDSSDAEESGI